MGDRGSEGQTDRQNTTGCRVAVSVEINDCGDERAGRLANGAGSWPAGQDPLSGQRWKTGLRLWTPRAPWNIRPQLSHSWLELGE